MTRKWETEEAAFNAGVKKARDAFLGLLADGKYEIDYDADYDEGTWRDLSTYSIRGKLYDLRLLCDNLGIKNSYGEDLNNVIQRAIEED